MGQMLSTGRHAAKRAEKQANQNAADIATQTKLTQDKTKKEKLKSQRLLFRQARASQGGGFFELSDTLG